MEARTSIADRVEGVEQIASAPRQAVELRCDAR
jgi:hypothetical protein